MTRELRNASIVGAGLVVAFAGGSGWQFAKARQARMERDSVRQEMAGVQREWALEQLEASLAMATVAAQFGSFERARQLASDFFARLQEEAEGAPESARSGLDEILVRRDGIITVLSRGQPESGLELATLLSQLQSALGREPTVPAHQQTGLSEDLRASTTG